MNFTFESLTESHFPLLLKWLEMPHVKAWWDQDVQWTLALIQKKYTSYVNGYKKLTLNDITIEKPIHGYIVKADATPIGYIQYYNRHDFPLDTEYETTEWPILCAGLDWYIGEPEYIGKRLGSKILKLFLEKFIFIYFDYVFVDPDTKNIAAVRAYEKAGFTEIKKVSNGDITWMINAKNKDILKG